MPEKAHELLGKLLATLKPRSVSHELAMELASELAACEKCKKCGGRGEHPRHIDCHHGCEDAWIRGCNEPVTCHTCRGFGRIYKVVGATP